MIFLAITIHTYRLAKQLERPLKEIYEARKNLIFIVPSREDKNLLLEMLSLKGFRFNLPQIWQWGDLYSGLSDILRRSGFETVVKRQLDPPDHWLVVRHLVHDILASSKELKEKIPAVGQPAFIETIGRQLHELIGEDTLPEDLSTTLNCKSCTDDCPHLTEPTGLLCHIYKKYLNYLNENDLADSAQIPILARKLLDTESLARQLKDRPFVLVGFMSFMRAQREFIDTLDDIGASIDIFKPDSTMGDKFYDAEQQFAEKAFIGKVSEDRPAKIRLFTCGDPRQELETLARNLWFKVEEGVLTFKDIAIEIPSSYKNIAEDVLNAYRIPWKSGSGKYLNETMCWDLVKRLKIAKDENWPFLATIGLLSNPLFGFDLPKEFLEFLKERIPSGAKEWTDILCKSGATELTRIIKKWDSFFDHIKRGSNVESLFQRLLKLLDDELEIRKRAGACVTDPSLDESLYEVSKFLEALEKKALSLAESLPELGPAQKDMLSEAEGWEYLNRFAEETRILPPKRKRESVTIYFDSSPVLATHKLYVVINATSQQWPGKITDPPLLNDEARRMIHENANLAGIHLPLRHERRQQKEALFRRHLYASTEETWLTFSAIDAQGRPNKLSPFLEMDGEKEDLYIIVEETRRPLSKLLPEGERFLREAEVPKDKLSRPRRKPIPSVKPKDEGYLSDIDTWVQCPALYAYRSILKLFQPKEAGLDAQKCGNMLHLLWSKAWKMRSSEKGLSLEACVEQLWEEVVESTYPLLNHIRKLHRHRERLRLQVLRLARIQEEIYLKLRTAFASTEWERQLPPFTINDVSFRGRADRIDHLKEIGQILWDYKTAGSKNYENSLQLASYALALSKADQKTGGAFYLCHSDSMCLGHISKEHKGLDKRLVPEGYSDNIKIKREKLEDIAKRAEEQLISWARDLTSGSFEPHYDRKTCKDCQYKVLCRKSEIEGGEWLENGEQ